MPFSARIPTAIGVPAFRRGNNAPPVAGREQAGAAGGAGGLPGRGSPGRECPSFQRSRFPLPYPPCPLAGVIDGLLTVYTPPLHHRGAGVRGAAAGHQAAGGAGGAARGAGHQATRMAAARSSRPAARVRRRGVLRPCVSCERVSAAARVLVAGGAVKAVLRGVSGQRRAICAARAVCALLCAGWQRNGGKGWRRAPRPALIRACKGRPPVSRHLRGARGARCVCAGRARCPDSRPITYPPPLTLLIF